MADVINFKGSGNPYRAEDELYNDLLELVYSYAGRTSLVATLGVIDLVKDKIISDAKNE